jgi:xanthine dehydrogenase YagS FAD-binding subunit
MRSFDYHRPATLAEAHALWEPGAAWLGGGTNLVDLMKTGAAMPQRLIDLTGLPDLDGIALSPDGSARIGALVRNADLAHDRAFAASYPMIAEALLSGASGQLRNAATVGGNLMQRTRCAYFADPHSPCNKRTPGAGCAAIGGVNGTHAVLGWSEACIATNPSDFAVPLAALGAVVEVAGPQGARDIPMSAFHRFPGDSPETDTTLAPGELVTGLRLPAGSDAFRGHSRYLKLRDRTSYAFALVSAAAALWMDGDRIAEARLALGGVAAKPWRVAEAEALMTGERPAPELWARAAAAATASARPSGDNAHKIDLARRVTARALKLAAAGTPARMPALPASVHGETAHA